MERRDDGVLIRIRAVQSSLKKAERRLADYVGAHPSEAARMTIHDLQEQASNSYATVIRFCKRLGFAGFKEFRNALIGDVSEEEIPVTTLDMATGLAVGKSDTPSVIADKVFNSSIAVLKSSRSILNPDIVTQAVARIAAAHELYFIGTGTSGLSAQYAYTRFFRIGITCSAQIDPTIYKQKSAILSGRDVLFAISSSGRSANVVDAAKRAKAAGAAVIALSDYAISPLTRVADINLHTTPRNVAQFMDKEMPLIAGQIALVDTLFACCCVRMGVRVDGIYEATKRAADSEKIRRRHVSGEKSDR